MSAIEELIPWLYLQGTYFHELLRRGVQALGAFAEDLAENVAAGNGWKRKGVVRRVCHGGVLLAHLGRLG